MTRPNSPSSIVSAVSLGAVCFFCMAAQWNNVRVGGHALEDLAMVLAFAAAFVDVLVHRRHVTLHPAIVIGSAGLAIVGLIAALFPAASSLTSAPPPLSLFQQSTVAKSPSNVGSMAKFEAALLLLPLMVAVVGTTHKRAMRVADAWALGAVLSAAVGVTDMLGVTHINQTLLNVTYAPLRQAGLTVQPNHLALESVMSLSYVATWLMRGRLRQLLAIPSIVLLVAAVYSSGSRTGAALLPVPLVFLFVSNPQARSRIVRLSPLFALLAVLVVLEASGTLTEIESHARLTPNAVGVVTSDALRAQLRNYALDDFNARPIAGVGYNVIDAAHNIYLQLLASGGVIALLSFGFLLLGVYDVLRQALRTAGRVTAGAMGAAVCVMLLNGVFGNQLTDRYIYVPVGVLVALAALARDADDKAVPTHVVPVLYEPRANTRSRSRRPTMHQ